MGKVTETRKLDAVLSRYVRWSNADHTGHAACFTCGVVKPWEELQCGHFQCRSKRKTRWLYKPEEGLVNVCPQCARCNMTNGGQQYIFGKRLDEVYGEGTADRVIRLSNEPANHTVHDLIEWRKELEEKLKG